MVSLENRRNELMLHFGQPFGHAGQIPLSVADRMIESKAFELWRKMDENKDELMVHLMKRVDTVTKAIVSLGNALASR